MKPSYQLINGLRMPMGFPPEALVSGLDYQATDSDIFVVSYPKSGTTWLQYVLLLLVRQRTLGPGDFLTDVFPHLEEAGRHAIESQPHPRLIKTHLRYEMTPGSDKAHYLVIARNPFDCAVSFYHHTRGFPRHYDFAGGSFADFFECFIAGEVDFGDYFDHLISWAVHADDENLCFLTYENLRRDTRVMIRRIAAFLGGQVSDPVASDEALDRIIAETSLTSMRRDQQRWSSKRPDWAPEFVRKGQVGDWRSLFSVSQARRLLAKFDRKLHDAGIDNPWPVEIAEARAFAGNKTSTTD